MLKRTICLWQVLITSAVSVGINTEIYHLIQEIKNKKQTKFEFRLSLKFKSSLSVFVI